MFAQKHVALLIAFVAPGPALMGRQPWARTWPCTLMTFPLEDLLGDRLGLFLSLSSLSLISAFTLPSSVLELMRVRLSKLVFLIFIYYFCNYTLVNIQFLQMGAH